MAANFGMPLRHFARPRDTCISPRFRLVSAQLKGDLGVMNKRIERKLAFELALSARRTKRMRNAGYLCLGLALAMMGLMAAGL